MAIPAINLTGRHPDSPGSRQAESHRTVGHQHGGCAVVILGLHADLCPWTNAVLVKKFQQLAVTLVYSIDPIFFPGRRLVQEAKAALAPLHIAQQMEAVAMGAGIAGAKLFNQFLLEGGGDCVFQAFSLFVYGKPRHAEYLRKHSLDQVMAENGAQGNLPALVGKHNRAVLGDPQQAVFTQALERCSYGRTGDPEALGKSGRDGGLPLSFGPHDGFQVIFFRNRNHEYAAKDPEDMQLFLLSITLAYRVQNAEYNTRLTLVN